MLAMYLLRLYSGEPLYETVGHIGTPGLCIFGWPQNLGPCESVIHDVINLLYYEHWIDKHKYFYI